ncbi:BglG family transcription antiterminator [Staphylococcus sp. ACRSN]|uniref:BglG family transcription antiterminator n=1 Tax=Staphylococcus sp. ACRSN TaxID=2918214 RepID=UPI001EF20209|nr:PRD domain-containing protein [Staphylococcus sp. ACRSN]MCG7339959.1 BglG family transcription antiterminator [Staphylococcus sp. ACRSN]
MFLSTREKEIIEMLIKYHGQYVKIYDIAQHLAVSSRTIHRELKSIETFLDTFNIKLERVNKKGIQLDANLALITNLKKTILKQDTIDLSQEEQKVIILYGLIQTKDPIKQYSLAHEIGVSTQTLAKLLDELEYELVQYQLALIKKRGEGIRLEGPESKKRELLSQLMVNNLNSTSVYSVIENHFVYQSLNASQLSMVDMDKIFQVERVLMDHLDQLPYSLTESSYLTLTVHIVLSIDRMLNGEYVGLSTEIYNSAKDTFEHEVASALALQLEHIYGVQFNQSEITFITIHLRGAKRKASTDGVNDDYDENIITEFVSNVAEKSNMTFTDLTTLTEGLKLHIIPAINRLRANIETYNPLTDMIKQNYPVLFNSITHALQQTWPELEFPDSEIAFIVLHFGGAIYNQQEHELSILVVCSSGIGTSRLLATRLEQTFSEITRTTQSSVSDLKQLNTNQFDAIISTVDLDINASYITVNPLLPDADIKHVAAFLNTHSSTNQNLTQEQDSKLEIMNSDATISFMRKGLELVDSVYIDNTDVTNWQSYLAEKTFEHQIINDKNAFIKLLTKRNSEQNFALDPYPIAIPHLKSDLIQKPFILITVLNKPIVFEKDNTESCEISYLLNMFIPADENMLSEIISDVSSNLVEHINTLDTFLQDSSNIKQILKQSYLLKLKKLLN